MTPAPDSTWVIAWYSCPRCGHDWSARIRNGRPEPAVTDDFAHAMLEAERHDAIV